MQPELVGRTIEQAEIETLVQRARGGRPQSFLVSGEPGIGKSSLLRHVVERCRRSGFRILALDADPIDAGLPYAALRLAAPSWRASAADDGDAAVHRLLDELVAGLDGDPRRVGPESAVPSVLHDLLDALAFHRPVLLAVDDVHCADAATVAALTHLVPTVRDQRVLLAITTRPDPGPTAPPGGELGRLAKEGKLDAIELGPFSDTELAELAERHLGRSAGPDLIALLRERTGGVPFYAVEVLTALAEMPTAADSDDVATSGLLVPRRLSAAVLSRVTRLGGDAANVAAAIAVLGDVDDSRLAIVAGLTGLPISRVEVALEQLAGAAIVVDDGRRRRFRHAIVRDAVYDDLGPAVRRRWHGEIARRVGAIAGTRDSRTIIEVATHLRRAAGGRDAVASAAFAAAGTVVASSDASAAVEWYRLALANLAPTDAGVAAAQLRLARALVRAAAPSEAGRIAAAVLRDVSIGSVRDEAVSVAAAAAAVAGDLDRAAEILDGASLGAARSPALLHDRARVYLAAGDVLAAATCLDRQPGVGEVGGSQAVLEIELLVAHCSGDFDRASGCASRLATMLVTDGPLVHSSARLALGAVAAFGGDPSVAAAYAAPSPTEGPLHAWFQAVGALARLRQGRLDDAVGLAEHAQRATAAGDLTAALVAYVLVLAHAERGDLLAASDAAAWFARAPFRPLAGLADCAVAYSLAVRGEYGAAVELLDEIERNAVESGNRALAALALTHRVDVATDAGDDGAVRALDRLDALPVVGTTVGLTMARLLAAGRLNGDDAAAEHAVAHAVANGLQIDAARARAALGVLRSDPGLLAGAYDELDRLGAVSRQHPVARELRRLGHRVPSRRRASHRFSQVEHDVAALVAQGLTNREVAAHMNLSPKTIEAHLSRLYRRTGCRTRVELAIAVKSGRLADHPADPPAP